MCFKKKNIVCLCGTTSIHDFCISDGWGLVRLSFGANKPAGYKKDVNAVAPLSGIKASDTLLKDNDDNRHPRQLFIYNTSVTDMLI